VTALKDLEIEIKFNTKREIKCGKFNKSVAGERKF